MVSTKNLQNISSRNVSFDFLRICASIMVIIIHVVATYWYSFDPTTTEWAVMNFYDCLARSSVPIFFMINGAFVLNRDIPMCDLYKNKILPLGFVYLIWSFLYAVDRIGIAGLFTINFDSLVRFVIESHFHLWFIPSLMGIYIMQPIFRAIVNYKDGLYVKYIVIIFLISSILRNTILQFVSNNTLSRLINTIPVEMSGYSGYVILGHYLVNVDKKKYNSIFAFIIFVITVSITAVICQINANKVGYPSDILYGNFMFTTYIEAVTLFLCIKSINMNKFNPKIQHIICKFSSLTLGVYLLHPFVISSLNLRFGLNILSYNTILSIPINSIIVAAICFFVTALMVKIPVIRKLWKY